MGWDWVAVGTDEAGGGDVRDGTDSLFLRANTKKHTIGRARNNQ